MANIKKPKDDNIDNIIREVLNVQDDTCPAEDTTEEDNVAIQQDDDEGTCITTSRPTILKTLRRLNTIKNDDITVTMPPHRLVEWKKHVEALEILSTSSFEKIRVSACSNEPNIPVRHSTDAIASTSGVTTMNKDIDNHSDEVNSSMDEEFGTQYTDYLHAEIVQVDPSDSENTLPDLELNIEENRFRLLCHTFSSYK